MRDFLGFSRNVIVQATCHGNDNRALLDALKSVRRQGARRRQPSGPEVSDAELQAMDAAGVRGVRFNFVKRLVDFTPREVLTEIARRIAPLGWHVVIYFEAPDLAELEPFFTSLPTTVVVDHMGRPDVALGIDHPQFRRFLQLHGRQSQYLEQGELSGTAVARQARPMTMSCRSPATLVEQLSRPRAVGHRLAASQHGQGSAR